MNPTLIETVRVRSGVAPLWYLHLRRLAASCQALGVPLPGELLTPEGGADRVHRLEVSHQGLTVTERPVPAPSPVRLVFARESHAAYPHKTTERSQFERALAEAREQGADDAILLVRGEYVAEAAIWTVLWLDGDTICAPPLALGILPSVARARVAELARVEERRVRPADLAGRPLVVGNAVRGLVRVAELDGARLPEWPDFSGLSAAFWS